jgi:predicted transcriptional regulator
VNNTNLQFVLIWAVLGVLAGALAVSTYMHSQRPTREEIASLLEKESKIYEMLKAKMDCEQTIPRTQECVLYYEYIVVE